MSKITQAYEGTPASLSLKPDNYDLALGVVTRMREATNYTLGTLLTLAEVALPEGQALKAYKDSIKREVYRMAEVIQEEIYYGLDVQKKKHLFPEPIIHNEE